MPDTVPKALIRNAPTQRNTGEKTETFACGENIRAIVSPDKFKQVLVGKIIIQPPEVIQPGLRTGGTRIVLFRIASSEKLIQRFRHKIPPKGLKLHRLTRNPFYTEESLHTVVFRKCALVIQ